MEDTVGVEHGECEFVFMSKFEREGERERVGKRRARGRERQEKEERKRERRERESKHGIDLNPTETINLKCRVSIFSSYRRRWQRLHSTSDNLLS